MSLEEQLDVAMKQRAILAAAVVGTMKSPCVSKESLKIKISILEQLYASGYKTMN